MPTNEERLYDGVSWGRWYWPVFLGVVFLFFIVPEVYALVKGQRNTLSDFVWIRLKIVRGERFSDWSALDLFVFVQWIGLVIWLTWHFFWHRFT